MKDRNPTLPVANSWRPFEIAGFAVFGALLCTLGACTPQGQHVQSPAEAHAPSPEARHIASPEVPREVLTPDCLEWAHVQEPMASLGLKALETFGRVDPGLYAPNKPGTPLRLSEGAQVPEQDLKRFQDALDRVNKDPKALEAFSRGHAAASKICAEKACPGTRYPVKIQPLRGAVAGDKVYQWIVEGPAFPTAVEWKAFQVLYAPRPALCPVLASLAIRSRASGVVQTEGMFAPERAMPGDEFALKNPCQCGLAGGYGRGGKPCSDCYFNSFLGNQCEL